MKSHLSSLVPFFLTALLISNPGALAGTTATPNVVIIFMDDMGYADIGPFGGDAVLTPNLNQLAKEGRRFTNFYVSQAVCSASRTSLLTGCYNIRVGIQGALGPKSPIGINADEMTLGELCQQQGYATACFGKWHLGSHEQFLPLQNGFDEYFGLPYSNDMWPFHPEVMHLPMEQRLRTWPHLPLIEGNKVINPTVTADDQKLLTRQYTDHAVSFIRRNQTKPFLLYVPHSMVHVPLFVSPEFEGKSGKGLFGDVLMEIDWSVGQIIKALKETGVEDNTLVIFTSDNGPWLSYGQHAGSAKPLREGKGTMFDGGCRVPCVMRWPGKIPPGTECTEPCMTIDILPTVAETIHGTLPQHTIDGRSILPLMTGDATQKSPHDALAFYWGNELHAVRSGNWKLHFPHQFRTLAGREGRNDGTPVKYENREIELSLFELSSDPGETNNVAAANPAVVKQLSRLADDFRLELGDGDRKGTGVRPAGRVSANK